MSTKRHRSQRRLSVIIGVALLGVGLAGAPALANPGSGGSGSITVHKFAQPETAANLPNDGSRIDPDSLSGLSPLGNVGFTVVPITGIDLADSGDWSKLEGLSVTLNASGQPVLSGAGPGVELGTPLPEKLTSDEDSTRGEVNFSSLTGDVAYVVYESTPLPGTTTVAQPAIVTVPYPNADGTGWNYDIHLYPKNVVVSGGSSKNATVVGDTITFTVSYAINDLGTDDQNDKIEYTQFMIEDTLSVGLSYQSSSVWLVDGADRTLVPSEEFAPISGANPLTLDFINRDGNGILTYLENNIGKSIEWEIVATANAEAQSTANTATLTVNGVSWDAEVPDPQPFHTGVHIYKQAMNKGATEAVPLAGAGFEIWALPNAATIAECPAYADLAGSALLQVGDTPVTSGTNGRTPDMVLASGSYCVYETVVPAGYKGATTGALLSVADDGASVSISNTQIGSDSGDLPSLPITGAAGRVLLMVGAGALAALAIGLYLVHRRRANSREF